MQSIKSPWDAVFDEFVDSIQESAIIAAPFITRQPVERLIGNLRAPESVRLDILTSLEERSLSEGAVDALALQRLCERVPGTTVRHLRNLHAKAYVADARSAIVSSANLTDGGLRRNYELGLRVTDLQAVNAISQDLREYADFGIVISKDALAELNAMARNARRTKAALDGGLTEYDNALDAIKERLAELRADTEEFRINPDATVTGKFADAVKYILRNRGALPTREIYPIIQDLMPEWCDDNIKRVVKGVPLDAKWRHDVLNAQQVLRRQGVIIRENGRWRLTS